MAVALMEPNMNFATIGTIQQAITLMLTSFIPIFLQTARTMLYAFATYRLVWRGIEWASSEQSFHHELFVTIKMILFLSLVFALLTFYIVPEPHFGISFIHLITDTTQWIANVLDAAALENSINDMGDLFNRFQQPDAYSILPNLSYWFLMVVVLCAKAAALFPIVIGLFGQSVMALLGPLCIPFLAVPNFSWIFNGWIRSFIKYSMIQVVAFAALFIFQRFVFNFSAGMPIGITVSQYPLYFTEAVVVIIVCCVMPMSAPSIASSLLSGYGSSDGGGRLLALVMRKRVR